MTSLSRLLPGFRPLSKYISVGDSANELNGTSASAPSTTTAPDSIFICTWADAGLRPIVKYVQGYRTLYPSAKIIVLQATTLGTFFYGQKANDRVVQRLITDQLFNNTTTKKPQDSLLPGHDANGHHHQDSQGPTSATTTKTPRNLVHVFSNAGGVNLEAICNAYYAVYHAPLPIETVIFDSTPGGEEWRRDGVSWYIGIAAGFGSTLPTSLPKWLLRILAFGISVPLVTFLMIIPCMLGRESLPGRCRRAVNAPNRIPLQSKRLYIYSDGDPLIHPSHIERHAVDAKKIGYPSVRLENFGNSTHVGHLRKDPERYWRVVSEVWDESVDGNHGKRVI